VVFIATSAGPSIYGLDADMVIHGISDFLFRSQVAFRGLHGNAAEQELDLSAALDRSRRAELPAVVERWNGIESY
jgi:hypothetical protein